MNKITLVDAPDKEEGPNGWTAREGQRTYHVGDPVKTPHVVRVRRDPDRAQYGYVVENLVGGKWHRLLEGDTRDGNIPFDEAAQRAANVLL